MARTTFFKSSLGVFQGGGCRAAAFVGAYEEAIRRGVSFTEVAGTSAGSIIAALLGAGASPADLNAAVSAMDFSSFTGVPDRKAGRSIAGKLLQFISPRIADLVFDQGFHSSKEVKNWINLQLNNLLPKEKHPVTFQSLPFPTYIVSTDLIRAEAKIWSQKTTPNEVVADAVQASCTIPIFFQPVGNRHVDGGLLSNLPTFVFSGRDQSERALASRVLAFALVADEADPSDWGTEVFLNLLANAVVDGSQQLQISLQRNVHVVKIPTGNVRATDFAKMTPAIAKQLIESGSAATRNFFDQELLHIQPAIPSDSVCYGTDELYMRAAESLDQPLERVIVADHNTDWVYSLFPSLFCWRARGVAVDAIVPELGDKEDGQYRRRLLRAMGANVTEIAGSTKVPLKAVVVVPQDRSRVRAVVGVEKQSRSQTIEAVLYQGFLDSAVSFVKKPWSYRLSNALRQKNAR